MSIGFLLASPQSRSLCELSAAVWAEILKWCNVVFVVFVVAAVVKSDCGSFGFSSRILSRPVLRLHMAWRWSRTTIDAVILPPILLVRP